MKYLFQNKNKEWELNKDYNIDKILYLLIDRPKFIGSHLVEWTNYYGAPHRDYNLPSTIITIKSLNSSRKSYSNYTYWKFYINGVEQQQS